MINYEINKKGRYGIITPLPNGVLANTIEKYTSYTRQGAEWMPRPEWGIIHLYSVKKGVFVWGLLNRVKDIFDKYIETYKDCSYVIKYDNESDVDTVVFNKRLRYYQIDAIKALIKNGGGILSMPTASGKTFTIIEYLKIMGKKSLVIVTTLDIKQQWRDEIGDNKNIYVENYQNKSLKSIIKDYDIIVYDESHHTSASTIYSLATATKTNAILIGCSGTPFREDGEDLKLEAALGNIVYKIDRKTLINEGFISNATVKYIKCSFPNDGKFMEYQEVYKTNIVENKDRNDKIVKIAIDNALQKKQVLILITQIEHGTKLLEDIKLKEPNLRIIFMNGGSKDRKIKFTDYDIIIASNIYTEGVNIPAMDVLIIGSGGRSSIQLNQKIGRVLRKTDTKSHAIIYDFIDAPKHLKTHYKRRREILSEDFEVEDE